MSIPQEVETFDKAVDAMLCSWYGRVWLTEDLKAFANFIVEELSEWSEKRLIALSMRS